jgi:hypothetical protein
VNFDLRTFMLRQIRTTKTLHTFMFPPQWHLCNSSSPVVPQPASGLDRL